MGQRVIPQSPPSFCPDTSKAGRLIVSGKKGGDGVLGKALRGNSNRTEFQPRLLEEGFSDWTEVVLKSKSVWLFLPAARFALTVGSIRSTLETLIEAIDYSRYRIQRNTVLGERFKYPPNPL